MRGRAQIVSYIQREYERDKARIYDVGCNMRGVPVRERERERETVGCKSNEVGCKARRKTKGRRARVCESI